MPKINKNMLLIAGLVIVVIAGYFTFFKKSDTSKQLTTVETSAANQVSPETQALMAELNRLKSLRSISKDIFSDPVFVSLEDFTQKVNPQPFGRSNPFAPIGSE